MLTTTDWLNALKHKTKISSDYGIAKLLELTPQRISRYKQKNDFLGPETAAKVADALGIDAAVIYAACHAERSRNDRERAIWTRIYQDIGGLQVEENIKEYLH
jgi:transcriptional regulator with XRE-family HTH domain